MSPDDAPVDGVVHLLHPPTAGASRVVATSADRDDPQDDLAALYAHSAPSSGALVRGNLVTTVDGAVAGPDGSSRSISPPLDQRVLVLLRSLADVVLVGAGTARAEGYGRLRVRPALRARRATSGQAPAPTLALVTRSGRLPDAVGAPAAEDADDRGSVVAVTCGAAGAGTLASLRRRLGADGVVVAGDDEVDLPAAVAALADRGLPRVLCEGGPALLGDVARAGLLDELCLTTSPALVGGDAPRALVGPALDRRLELAHLLLATGGEDDGTLLARWVVRR